MAESSGTLPVAGIKVPWVLRRSKRARTYHLRPLRDGRIEVVVPRRGSQREGIAFLERQAEWARDQHLAMRERTQIPFVRFADGAVVPVDGRDRTLWISVDDGLRSVKVVYQAAGSVISISHPPHRPWLPGLLAWLRGQARDRLTERVRYWAPLVGVVPGRIAIKDTRSRWGSASSKGNLNLSWRLILAPPEVLDYLVLHEVCHLRQPNHSQVYWNLVRDLMPDFATHRAWLKGPGELLLHLPVATGND